MTTRRDKTKPGDGLCDLHCHLLYGLDDGARTLNESLEMARILVDLGFSEVAPSPHARSEYPPGRVALERLAEVQSALTEAQIPLALSSNAENYLFEDQFLQTLGTTDARLLGNGPYLLVELPYTAPVPTLLDLIFQMRLKGVRPLFAHPERCLEFQRKGRAAEAVAAGALLQLDIGALIGRYGRGAKALATQLLEEGLYALAATDLHSPSGAREWLERSLSELRHRIGERGFTALISDQPKKILAGEPLA
jgi:protein-tyrosine phosphatase